MVKWSIFCIVLSMILMVLLLNRKLPVTMARTLWAPGILKIAGVKDLIISGMENVDRSKTYVVAANHLSYLDIPILFKVLPINLYFVAKSQLKYLPFVGWYMMATGMIFVDRKNRNKAIESLQKAGEHIKSGKSVFMFPEGTRSKTGEIGEFKKGAFALAKMSKVDILPVHLKGTGDIWSVNHGKLKPGNVEVQIMPSIPFTNLKTVLVETQKSITSASE